MVFKKLFPRKAKDKEKVQAELKAMVNRLKLKSRQFTKKSYVMRVQAKKALKTGNRSQAKNMLLRWKKYNVSLTKYTNITARIERHLDALEEASIIKDVGNVLGKSAKTLEKVSTTISPEKALEISETAEESIAKIEEAGDLLGGDLEEDFGFDIEEELTRLETELVLEDAGSIPTAPSAEMEGMEGFEGLDLDLEGPADDETDKEKLKKELEKLKKELES